MEDRAMNKENIQKLIDVIRTGREDAGFNMSFWRINRYKDDDGTYDYKDHSGRDCGTTYCIGGWIDLIAPEYKGREHEFLGIDEQKADELFYMNEFMLDYLDEQLVPFRMREVTQAQALEVLEHLRDTGEVDWARVLNR